MCKSYVNELDAVAIFQEMEKEVTGAFENRDSFVIVGGGGGAGLFRAIFRYF